MGVRDRRQACRARRVEPLSKSVNYVFHRFGDLLRFMCSMSASGDSTSNRGVARLPAAMHPHIPGHTWEHQSFAIMVSSLGPRCSGPEDISLARPRKIQHSLGLAGHIPVLLSPIWG